MELTHPLPPDELLAAYTRELRGVAAPELLLWLEMEESALRAEFRVSRTDTDANAALRQAMLTAWPAFSAQVRAVASESVSTDGVSQSYAAGAPVRFPAFVARILAPVADPAANTIRIVRG